MGKDVEVMENVELEPEIPVEVVPPTPMESRFDVSAIGKTFSNRVGDVAMNMIASAAVVGAANGAMWIGRKVSGFVKNQIDRAKEAKALKEKVQAELQEAETTSEETEE